MRICSPGQYFDVWVNRWIYVIFRVCRPTKNGNMERSKRSGQSRCLALQFSLLKIRQVSGKSWRILKNRMPSPGKWVYAQAFATWRSCCPSSHAVIRIVQVHDDICEARDIKLLVLGRKFNAPATDSAFIFKWDISFIFEVQLKESGIVLSTRSRNCLRCSILVDDIWTV